LVERAAIVGYAVGGGVIVFVPETVTTGVFTIVTVDRMYWLQKGVAIDRELVWAL
jgi:hypothetical protein